MLKKNFFRKNEDPAAAVRDALKSGKDEISVTPRGPSEAMSLKEMLERRGFNVMIEDDGGKLTLSAARRPPKSIRPAAHQAEDKAAHREELQPAASFDEDAETQTAEEHTEDIELTEDKREAKRDDKIGAESYDDKVYLPSEPIMPERPELPSYHQEKKHDEETKHKRDIEIIERIKPQPLKTAVIFSCALAETERHLCDMISRSYLDAILKHDNTPNILILKDNAVKLAIFDSSACDRLKNIERRGTKILICGTAANYFGITEKIGAGIVSSPFEILEALEEADKVINI